MKKKIIKGVVLLGVLLSVGVTSCRVINSAYKTPEVQDKENLFRAEHSADTTTIADITWREYFKDPILNGLIEEGLKNNFDLQIATVRIEQAEAGLKMAHGAFFPNVALVGQVQQTRFGANGGAMFGGHNEQYALGVSATWEADIWGKLRSQSKAKYAQLMGSHSYRNLVQTSLISNIATSYYSLLALDEQLSVTKETVKLLTESTESMQVMMEAGLLTGAAVEQNKGLLYATQVSIPDLEINIKTLENSLSLLLGRNPGTISRSSIHDQTVPLQLEYGVPAQMLSKRPDVQQAEFGFRSAFELRNVAKASFYPSLTLNSGSMAGYTSTVLSNFFKPENIFANILGGLTQPLFAQNRLKGQLKIANSQQQEALLTFEKTVISAGKEVSDILITYQASLSKNELRTKQIGALNNSVYFTKELLQAGEANYIEVLNAEQSLLQARIGQVNDKLQQLQASVNLYRALGGGVE